MNPRIVAVVACALGVVWWRAPAGAQVDVEASLQRYDYLLYEPLLLEVSVTNRSARPVKLESRDGKPWLQIMVAKVSGEIVPPRRQFEADPLELEAGKSVTRVVNLAELFFLEENSRCEVSVKLVMPSGQEKRIGNVKFFVGKGVTVWEETVGVLVAAEQTVEAAKPAEAAAKAEEPRPGPKYSFVRNHGVLQKPAASAAVKEEQRTYSLIRFATQGDNNFLYLRVSDPDSGIIYGCYPLGKVLPFYKPQARLDNDRNLHVLFQTGARLHVYYRVSPQARVLERADVTSHLSTPALERREDGFVFLSGGERR
jgi:hypothetical protein